MLGKVEAAISVLLISCAEDFGDFEQPSGGDETFASGDERRILSYISVKEIEELDEEFESDDEDDVFQIWLVQLGLMGYRLAFFDPTWSFLYIWWGFRS